MMNEKIQGLEHYPDRRKFLKTGFLFVSGLAFSQIAKGEVLPSTALLTQGPHDAFTAVMRPGLSGSKIQAVRQYGGDVAIAPPGMASVAYLEQLLAGNPNGYNLNQFADTEKVLDTFDADSDKSMNVAAEVFRQIQLEPCPCPEWFIAGAGSGGTATSIARYIRKWADLNGRDCHSKLAVVDPEISVLYD